MTKKLYLILKGNVQEDEQREKIGVVSVVFISEHKATAEQQLAQIQSQNKDDFFMLYDCPLDTDLEKLDHYPSIAISKDDLL